MSAIKTTSLNRRSFFGVAAASPFAAKDVAKKVIEDATMQASGVSTFSDGIYTGIITSGVDDTNPIKNFWDAMLEMGGLPEWKRDDLWEDARRNRTLDPDIAAMRSLSLQGKMQLQWRRNYDRLVKRAFAQRRMERAKKAFFQENPNISEY